ncbi:MULTISPECIES: flagellar brake protein [Cupriavidus]|uniref:Type IV pilus assembly PilZ n=2 Tax=Cupriavidus pinatubonensis TaxID=248026 RepID=Q472Q1_CUPPJ|nr:MULTISPECIES: flagellar brake protein [Cupriavidus]CAG9178643.1 hypothetical protein LMG23994_03953 [Cupriavidus pinatubonensis]
MIHLSPNDLPVGAPLPWSLLDGDGNLVLGSGNVIPDTRDVALVFRHGELCRLEADSGGDPQDDPLPRGPLGLQVGTLLHVKQPGDNSRAAASRLIGFVEQGLFMTWPQLGGRDLPVQAGDTLLLRGFSGRVIHSFTSTITAVCRSPFRYLVLSAPSQLDQMPVRKAARVPTRMAAYMTQSQESFQEADQDAFSAEMANGAARLVMVSDLSTGGAQIHAAGPAPVIGSRVQLRFRLRTASLDSEIVADAWVRAVTSDTADAEFPSFGISFDVLGEREMTLLQCFIYEQLLTSSGLGVHR